MQNRKSDSLRQGDQRSRLNNIGEALSKDQMKKIQGGSCQEGDIVPCLHSGGCSVSIGGGFCCIASC